MIQSHYKKMASYVWSGVRFVHPQKYELIPIPLSDIAGVKKKEREGKGTKWVSQWQNVEDEKKNRATGNRSQSRRRFTAKLKPPSATKLLRSIRNTSPSYPHELDSEGMTSLHTTGSSSPYILPAGWSHFSTMLALILLEIEYSYERGTLCNTFIRWEAGDKVARTLCFVGSC